MTLHSSRVRTHILGLPAMTASKTCEIVGVSTMQYQTTKDGRWGVGTIPGKNLIQDSECLCTTQNRGIDGGILSVDGGLDRTCLYSE